MLRYLLVDRIEEIKKFEFATGTKSITLSEDCFEHHFPGQPVYPGALLIESMAQLGGALIELSLRDEIEYCPRCVLSSIKARFRAFVNPGDTLRLKAEILSRHEESAKVRVSTQRNGDRVCEAEMIFILLRIEDPRLESARREYLDVLTRKTRYIE